MEDEVKSLMNNETWIVVERPPGAKLLSAKWVFKKKDEPNGDIRYKARLVACGYLQKAGVDYNETFSPVARLPTIRTVLAVALQFKLSLRHLDVKTAFLNGVLEEDIYLKYPEGIPAQSGTVLKLQKSMYGLKQSPRQLNTRFNQFITSLGFKQCPSKSCLYVRQDATSITFICLYVDDMLIACSDEKTISELIRQLNTEFQMTDLSEPKKFMGLNITYNMEDGYLQLDQTSYAEQLLCRFGMKDSKPVATPLDHTKLTRSDVASTDFPYREAVGSIMYLVLGTRPDLGFAIGYLSRFQETPDEEHATAIKRVLRYIRGTTEYQLHYHRNDSQPPLKGFVDSDWASDIVDRKSTSGFLFKVYGNLVQWSSRKQPLVALSTTESEYVAACTATQEATWFIKILEHMQVPLTLPISLMEDNQGCIFVAKNSETKRSKHIDTKWHFLRECVNEKKIILEYVPTQFQEADLLTKPLPRPRLEELCRLISLKRGRV